MVSIPAVALTEKGGDSMGKFLLLSVALLVTPALAQNGPAKTPPGNSARSGDYNAILAFIITASNKPQCNSASPTHPCKGNNGFGNGGGDGSPNGKEDLDR